MLRREKNMQWDYRKIRKDSWNTVFHKSRKSWLMLVAVGFLFAFAGASNASQITFIGSIDRFIGANDEILSGNIEILKEYIVETPLVKNVSFITSDFALSAIDILSKRETWVIKLLGANLAYFRRNPGEVIANMLAAALIAAVIRFFIQNVVIVGRNRYVMENRFEKEVSLRRILAPFHIKTLWHVIRVMLCYNLTIMLWSFTIVGGVYKYYQYGFVPYILAENPSAGWREAKRLSRAMTKGCKWKIFCTRLSYSYIWLLKLIPLVGLFVAVPLEMQLDAELYFTLRNTRDTSEAGKRLFTEPVFSGCPYTEMPESNGSKPDYALKDLSLELPERKGKISPYSVMDFIFMFFTFCLIGWLWECGLHMVRQHEFVNRGTLYGPWIPIYGVGGTAVVFLFDRFKENKFRLLMLELALCAVLEYLTSFLLDFIFNSSYWDYKTEFLNINGRICFAALTAFGIGGMAAIYVLAPVISGVVSRCAKKPKTIVAALLCSAFLADIVCCLLFGFNSGAGVGGRL